MGQQTKQTTKRRVSRPCPITLDRFDMHALRYISVQGLVARMKRRSVSLGIVAAVKEAVAEGTDAWKFFMPSGAAHDACVMSSIPGDRGYLDDRPARIYRFLRKRGRSIAYAAMYVDSMGHGE